MSKKLIIAGRGVRISGAVRELFELSLRTNVPIATTILGKDLIMNSVGSIGIKGTVNVLDYNELLVIGASLPVAQTGYDLKEFNRRRITVVNIERPNPKIRCKWIQADCKDFLTTLLKRM